MVDGAQKTVEFSYQGPLQNALRYTFRSRDLHALFDRLWHKLSISVQTNIVSIYMDCKLIERRLIDDRGDVDRGGRTVIATRVESGRPVDVGFFFPPQLSIGLCFPHEAFEEFIACCLATFDEDRAALEHSLFSVIPYPQLC